MIIDSIHLQTRVVVHTLRIALPLVTAIGLLFMLGGSVWAGPPVVGHTFYGSVKTTSGGAYPAGIQVTAKASSGPWTGSVSVNTDASGSYFLTVPGDDPTTPAIEGAQAGSPIVFRVAGVTAQMYDDANQQVSSVAWSSGGLSNINLRANVYLTINASAGTGGQISPLGSVSVLIGASRTFNVTADSGYAIANVVVDGQSKGAISSFTFNNVIANHAISASFKSTTGDILGYVFFDVNGNGTRDPEETAGLAGVEIKITLPNTTTLTTLTTPPAGAYQFLGLAPGRYRVQMTQPAGYAATSPIDVTVDVVAATQQTVNFGLQVHTPTPSPTSSATPTATPSPTNTPTNTPTPTATPWRCYLPLIVRNPE